MLKIDCISDLHGSLPPLEGGDLLIVAGDLTRSDKQAQYLLFREWLRAQDYRHKVWICGNHDGCIESGHFYFSDKWIGGHYLQDSMVQIEGYKIWGTPWTPIFYDWAFMKPDTVMGLGEIYRTIPDDVDILVSHGPPKGILDTTMRESTKAGSKELLKAVNRIRPKLHVFGHIHEGYGRTEKDGTIFVNCAHMTWDYKPLNKAIRVELDDRREYGTQGTEGRGHSTD